MQPTSVNQSRSSEVPVTSQLLQIKAIDFPSPDEPFFSKCICVDSLEVLLLGSFFHFSPFPPVGFLHYLDCLGQPWGMLVCMS